MSYRHQNMSDGKLPLWRYGRAWWRGFHWWWAIGHRSSLALFAASRWGFSLYLGPIGHLCIYAFGSGTSDDERGRFEVGWSDGCLYFNTPLVRQNEWRRSDSWWRKTVRLRLVDLIFGRLRMELTEGEPIDVFVPMPEGCYHATATPYTVKHKRRFLPARRWHNWKIDVPAGIPRAGKGENSWDCGDDASYGLSGPADSVHDAIGKMVASALRDRARYGHDSRGTGAAPVVVVGGEDE